MPDLLRDAIVSHPDTLIMVWLAGHIYLEDKYCEIFKIDNARAVRAVLQSNPTNTDRCFTQWGFKADWKERFASLTHIERLALMKSPDLPASVLLTLMLEKSDDLSIAQSEHIEIVSVAIVNPYLIQMSRHRGRKESYSPYDVHPPMEEFSRALGLGGDGLAR